MRIARLNNRLICARRPQSNNSMQTPTTDTGNTVLQLSLYKILFQSKVLSLETIHLFIAPPHLLRLPFCNTIARLLRNIRPPTDPPSVCHTLYTIGDGNIV